MVMQGADSSTPYLSISSVESQLNMIINPNDNLLLEPWVLIKVLLREEHIHRDLGLLLRDLSSPLSILLILADPATEAPLRLGDEKRALEQALLETEFGDSFVVEDLASCRLEDLGRGLRRHKPRIVHFSGHGGDEGLVFVGQHGEAISRDLDLLAKLLANALEDGLEAVILNACDLSTQAQQLANTVGRVVAMDGPIEDPSAIAFTKSFYSTLGSGKSFETAFLWAVDETAWNTSVAGAAPKIFFSENKR
jgi:CHAT domain